MSRSSTAWSRLLAPGAIYHLLASTAFVVVFAIVPFSLYLHSGEAWALTPTLLIKLAGFGLLAFVAAALALRLLAALSGRAATGLAIGLFCLGVFVLLAHVYAPVAIGPLDGDEIRSDEPLAYTLIEAVLLLAAVALFVLLWRGRGLTAASVFAGVLWLVGVGYGVAAVWPNPATSTAAADPTGIQPSAACDATGNVYQFVLDQLETDAFLEVTQTNDWSHKFQGFDLFANNIANYLVTNNSMPSYLSGTFYHAGALQQWRRSSENDVFDKLDNVGFMTWEYAPYRNWPQHDTDIFQSNVDIYRARIGDPQAELYDLVRVWLTSLAPNPLTNDFINVSDTVASVVFEFLTASPQTEDDIQDLDPKHDTTLLKDGFHSVASALLLEQVALDESVRTTSCNYIYVHALLPHTPFALDGRCRYDRDFRKRVKRVGTTQAYLDQTECVTRKIIDVLEELKTRGVYDAATIVVHADTGSPVRPRVGLDGEKSEILGHDSAKILGLTRALLMIKRPHAQGSLELVETPTQLVDIYPTILDLLDIEPHPGLHGRSIYGPPGPPREARFAFDPEDKWGPNLIEVRIDDPSDLEGSTLTVVGPATDPAVWRDEIRRAQARSPQAGKPSGVAASSTDRP